MHIITRKALVQFWERHPDSQTALQRWFKIVQKTDFHNFAELRAAFPSADQVDHWVVFNIGGNKYRLIASIHFNRTKSTSVIFFPTRNMTKEIGNMTFATPELQTHWQTIAPVLTIRNEREYNAAVKRLNELLDEIGADEKHPLYSLLDTLGTLIEAYEEEHHPIPEANGSDVLRFLMDEHGLTQSDLPEVGSQGVVSEILNGKRELNVRQIRKLAERFHVSPAAFM